MAKREPFYFRFYETNEMAVKKCIGQMAEKYDMRLERIVPITLSVNPFVPSNSLQAEVTFASVGERNAFMADGGMTAIYLAANPSDGTLEVRTPKSLAYRVA